MSEAGDARRQDAADAKQDAADLKQDAADAKQDAADNKKLADDKAAADKKEEAIAKAAELTPEEQKWANIDRVRHLPDVGHIIADALGGLAGTRPAPRPAPTAANATGVQLDALAVQHNVKLRDLGESDSSLRRRVFEAETAAKKAKA